MTDDPLDAIELRRGLENMAEMMRVYYESLIQQGFSKREALQLTMSYQRALTQPDTRGESS